MNAKIPKSVIDEILIIFDDKSVNFDIDKIASLYGIQRKDIVNLLKKNRKGIVASNKTMEKFFAFVENFWDEILFDSINKYKVTPVGGMISLHPKQVKKIKKISDSLTGDAKNYFLNRIHFRKDDIDNLIEKLSKKGSLDN